MESTRPKAPVDAVHRRSRGWRRRVERRGMKVLIRTRTVSRIVITVVKMTLGVSEGWRITQRERENRALLFCCLSVMKSEEWGDRRTRPIYSLIAQRRACIVRQGRW